MNRRALAVAGLLAFGLAVFSASTVGRIRPEIHTLVVGAIVILAFVALGGWRGITDRPGGDAEVTEDYIAGYAAGIAHQQLVEGVSEEFVRGHGDGWLRRPLPPAQARRLAAVRD